jgi:hypothetical protein
MLLYLLADPAPSLTLPVTVHLPHRLWEALKFCAPDGGEVNAVICEALEAHLARTLELGRKKEKTARLVALLSQPITVLDLSGRAERALVGRDIRHVYNLVGKTRRDIYRVPSIGPKSLREVENKLAAFGLSLSMALDAATYRAAVVQAHLADRSAPADGKEG